MMFNVSIISHPVIPLLSHYYILLSHGYPLVNVYITMENHHFEWVNYGKSPF